MSSNPTWRKITTLETLTLFFWFPTGSFLRSPTSLARPLQFREFSLQHFGPFSRSIELTLTPLLPLLKVHSASEKTNFGGQQLKPAPEPLTRIERSRGYAVKAASTQVVPSGYSLVAGPLNGAVRSDGYMVSLF